jgi:ParB family transcriptional regulator, chromosome partitioning protein
MNKPDPRKALGKGIDALMRSRPTALQNQAPPPEAAKNEMPLYVSLEEIDPNPFQPRRIFEEQPLQELAASIQANGIIQPLVVRKMRDRYQLVAGERRFRASRIAGLKMVPVVIREIPDERLLEITLIENIQREDLSPIETAVAFSRMARELNLTPEQIGTRTGKDRSTVANYLRLLQLPSEIQDMIANRQLTGGHARALLVLPSAEMQLDAAHHALKTNLSVRQLESHAQRMIDGKKPKAAADVKQDPNVKAALQELESVLGTRVRIVEQAKGKGRIEILYYSSDDLDRLYEIIVRP